MANTPNTPTKRNASRMQKAPCGHQVCDAFCAECGVGPHDFCVHCDDLLGGKEDPHRKSCIKIAVPKPSAGTVCIKCAGVLGCPSDPFCEHCGAGQPTPRSAARETFSATEHTSTTEEDLHCLSTLIDIYPCKIIEAVPESFARRDFKRFVVTTKIPRISGKFSVEAVMSSGTVCVYTFDLPIMVKSTHVLRVPLNPNGTSPFWRFALPDGSRLPTNARVRTSKSGFEKKITLTLCEAWPGFKRSAHDEFLMM